MVNIKGNAPLKSKSGSGYHFEHKVAAYFLSYLLANKIFDRSLGEILRIDFQMRGDYFQIDDLCITFNFMGENKRLFLSVKSNFQFTKNAAPKDFVEAAWIDFTGFSGSKFDKDKDLLGLACAPYGHENELDLNELLNLAFSQDSKDLDARIFRPNYTSERVRSYFSSFKCPPEIAEKYGITDDQIGDLLKHIKVYPFDFEFNPSEKEISAISNCQNILSSGSQIEAEKLWIDLIELSSEKDETNGYIDLKVLLDRFRLKYDLKNFPVYEHDFRNLETASNNFIDAIPDKIGGKLSLKREKQISEVLAINGKVTLILGISGSGKSVIAKKIAEQKRNDQKIIWFDAGWFNDQSIPQLERNWQLSHSISELFTNISDNECWIIIDGLDRIVIEHGFNQLFQIIKSCNITEESTPWKMLLTCQTEEWNNRVLFQFLRHDLNRINWNTFDLKLFNDEEINQITKEFPSLKKILQHPHLKLILSRPKIIDLLATHETPDTSKWVGESDLIEWFWLNEVTSRPLGAAKSSFLQNLAKRQAETWQISTPVSEILPSDLTIFDDFKKRGICTINQNRIQFSHDLFGDWSRQQYLISHIPEDSTFFKKKCDSPLWHRGIRLLGLYLLEQNQNPTEFLKVFFSIQKENNEFTTIHDLLLESIIFSVNPQSILEKLWPEFEKDDGNLLKRFLKRFLIIATIPNRRILIIGKILGISENEAALIDRIPILQYWIPILQFINQRKDEFEKIAPESIIDIGKGWLKYTPLNTTYRQEIADLSLTIAEKIKKDNSRRYYKNPDLAKKAYSCAIAAVNDDPERVTKLLLSLSGKGNIDPSEKITDQKILSKQGEYSKKVLPPWPDGPFKHVDDLFQKMCIQEDELLPIIICNPELAKDILFGLIIEEPRIVDSDYDDDFFERELGLKDYQGVIPALPYNGPFLDFLFNHPLEAIDLIIRIVNFATERHIERKIKIHKKYSKSDLDLFSDFDPVNEVELLLANSPKILKGDHEVYFWYRDSVVSCCPRILSSMLMALERFLYIKIDKKDSIDSFLQIIYEKTNSVALLGVLTSVGKYKLSLFEGPLKYQFSIPEIYRWEMLYDERSLSIFGLLVIGDRTRKQFSEWHSLQHRKIHFYNLAIGLFLNYPNIRSEIEKYRQKWEERLISTNQDSHDYFFLFRLIQQMNIENYTTKKNINGNDYWYFNEPEELKQLLQKGEEEFNKSQEGGYALNFLFFCSNALKKAEMLDSIKIEQIWDYIQTFSSLSNPKFGTNRPFRDADVLAGGIAVLIVLGKKWLEENPDKKQWCIDHIFDLIANPPTPGPFDVPQTANEMQWDSFCAWAAPYIWIDDVKSTRNREMIFHLATSYHYKTIEILINSCFSIRGLLKDDFYELIHLNVINSLSRTFCQLCIRDPKIRKTNLDFEIWLNQELHNFIHGKFSPKTPSIIEIIGRIGEFTPPGNFGGRKWNAPEFHNRLSLQSSFQWLSSLNTALDEKERECWINLVKNLNAYVIYSINDTSRPKNDTHLPDDFDRWYFQLAATFITEMRDYEHPEDIWQSLLDLEISKNDWIETFFSFWFIQMYNCMDNPKSFVHEWQKMIEYTLKTPLWNYYPSNNHSLEERWCELIGIERGVSTRWKIEFKEIVTDMKDFFEKWARVNLPHFHCQKNFISFLRYPACSGIRVSALNWIEQYGYSVQLEQFWKDSEQNSKLAELLNLCWENDRQSITNNFEIFSTFKRLLKGLTDCQISLAMELTEKIRTTL